MRISERLIQSPLPPIFQVSSQHLRPIHPETAQTEATKQTGAPGDMESI